MARLFGTDGVRGVAGRDITCDTAFQLGQAGAIALAHGSEKPLLLIGRDTRASGDMLEAALLAGILSTGAKAACLGVIPTPGIAMLTRHYAADAGVVISASHNPAADNGIKFFSNKGMKLPDETEDVIEAIINAPEKPQNAQGVDVGRRVELPDAIRAYEDALVNAAPCGLSGLRVVIDCANGAASGYAKRVLTRLGTRVTSYFDEPSGLNINDGCGSTHPQRLCELVVAHGADAGLAFDGDADRLIAVDERGRIVHGDHMLAILGGYMKRHGQLSGDTVVATVMSNMGFDIALNKRGIRVERAAVGDRYVLERMMQGGFALGGEQSGHIIFASHNPTGDGILTSLNLLGALLEEGRPFSELANEAFDALPQCLLSARITPEQSGRWQQNDAVKEHSGRIERELEGTGRLYIRASGTEPVVRVLVESPDEQYVKQQAELMVKLIEAV